MANQAVRHEPFLDAGQQQEAALLGMYVFAASEIMLFGGIVVTALLYRTLHPQEYVAASKHLHLWIGAFNTVILITSSLAVALAIAAARRGAPKRTAMLLLGAAVLGLAFLVTKAGEYRLEYTEGLLPGFGELTNFDGPVTHLFMDLYLVATALHAVHLSLGIALMSVLAWRTLYGRLALPARFDVVQVSGVYWHLVDVIWIFLYPILYLAR